MVFSETPESPESFGALTALRREMIWSESMRDYWTIMSNNARGRRTFLTNDSDNITPMDQRHPRETLASNINALIDSETPKGERRSVRAWALKKGLDVRLIDRISKGEHAITIDKLDEIAKALDLKPWHLLMDEFEPGKHPPAVMTDVEQDLLEKLKALLK
jgi:hypothetical protein